MLSSTPLRLYAGSLAIVLAYLVLSHGGLDQPNWHIGLLVLALISIVYWTRTSAEELAPPLGPWIAWPAVLFPVYVACQLLPLPVDVLRVLSPSRAQLMENLARVGEHVRFAPISIKPEVTSAYLLRIVAYAVFFLLIRELAWHARKRQSFALAMPLVAIAAIEAVSGLVQSALGADTVGAYGNKNHLAGLLEMILPVTLAVGFALIAGPRSRSDSRGARTLAGGAVLLLAALFLAGLVATVSKMGYVAALCGLAVMGAVALATTVHGWPRWLAAAALAALFAFGLIFLPSDELMRAFGTLFSDEWSTGEGRWPVFLNALNLIRAFPLAGCGLGNFQTGFLRFQAAIIDRDFSFAHNDYLQLASELGLAGFAIVAALALAIFWKAFCAAIQERDQMARSLGLGCVGALTAIGVHSLADFNTYIPANAMVLAWIFGMAASLPGRGSTAVREPQPPGRIFSRGVPVFLTVILILFAPAWIVFETRYHGNSQAERQFCRFGICDTDAVLEAEAAGHGGNVAALPVAEIQWALGRDAASPTRWCDLGEAFAKRREITAARLCFSAAVALGPYVPIVLRRASQFALDSQEQKLALQENGRVLEKTSAYDDSIFQWYRASKIPVPDVLANGLALDRRASQAYLRYWMNLGNGDVAAQAWDWILAHSFADAPLARDYVNFVFNSGQYKKAAGDWARYLGHRRNGYLQSDWLYNGDFESEPDGLALDWRLEGVTDQVEVARDATVAHTGAYSLRVQFLGKENVNFSQTFQAAHVRPGSYRLEAFIRTEGITTDQGIGLQISSDDPPLNVKTEQRTGTHDWQKIEQTFAVPAGCQLVIVRVVRQPSLKFDSLIAGTAWIDSVRLLPIDDRNAADESSALNLPAKRAGNRH
jgi:O-antigen ligase/tetratricopeptide (TPR) repeat protein